MTEYIKQKDIKDIIEKSVHKSALHVYAGLGREFVHDTIPILHAGLNRLCSVAATHPGWVPSAAYLERVEYNSDNDLRAGLDLLGTSKHCKTKEESDEMMRSARELTNGHIVYASWKYVLDNMWPVEPHEVDEDMDSSVLANTADYIVDKYGHGKTGEE